MASACPLCGARRPRRACPALGQLICARCCGSKRLVEIACPSDCGYLASARAHPPAVLQRRRERDLRFLLPLVHGCTERQQALFALLHRVLVAQAAREVPPLRDEDAAAAAGALAATLETADKGIIYEHQAASVPAQRLVAELKRALDELAGRLQQPLERDVAAVLRRIERGARQAAAVLEPSPTAYLELAARMVAPADEPGEEGAEGRPASAPGADADPRVILP